MEKHYTVIVQTEKGNILDHQECAKYIKDLYCLTAVDDNIFMYNAGIREHQSKQAVQNIILTTLNSITAEYNKKIKGFDINEIYHFIVTLCYNQGLKNALNNPTEYDVNFADEILDVKTMKRRMYTPNDNKIYKLDVIYSKTMTSPPPQKLISFLYQILEGHHDIEKTISFLQEYIGHLLIPLTKFEKSLLLLGSGANGKSVLLNIVRAIIGVKNISTIGLHELHKEQSRYNLLGKLVLIDSDLQQSVQLDSGIIKKISSGEIIDGKPLYRQILEFRSTCRILCASNHAPYIKSIDDSIKRRFLFIHLKKSFVGKENPNLLEEILTERVAIVGRAVKGLVRLLNRGKFDIPGELSDTVNRFVEDHDSCKKFMADSGVLDINNSAKVPYHELYSAYKKYCQLVGLKASSMNTLNKRLREMGFDEYRTEKERGFQGVGLCNSTIKAEGQNDNLFHKKNNDEG